MAYEDEMVEQDDDGAALVGMPGGENIPSPDLIAKWHKQFPKCQLRGFPFPDLYIVYRSYTMSEQDELARERAKVEMETGKDITTFENNKIILNKFVLWPKNFIEMYENDELPAGIPNTIVGQILMNSGYVDLVPEIL